MRSIPRSAALILLSAMLCVTTKAQEADKPTLTIDASRWPLKKGEKMFHFLVEANEKAGTEILHVELFSVQGLHFGEPILAANRLNQSVLYRYEAVLPEKELNLAEIQASLVAESKSGRRVLNQKSWIVDLGFKSASPKVVWSLSKDGSSEEFVGRLGLGQLAK